MQSSTSEPPSPDCVYSKQKVTDITYLRVKCKLTRSVAQIKHQFSKVYPGTRSGNHTKEGFIKILLPTRSTLYTVHCTYKNDMLVFTLAEGSEATSM